MSVSARFLPLNKVNVPIRYKDTTVFNMKALHTGSGGL